MDGEESAEHGIRCTHSPHFPRKPIPRERADIAARQSEARSLLPSALAAIVGKFKAASCIILSQTGPDVTRGRGFDSPLRINQD